MALKEQVPNVYSVGLYNVGSYQVSGTPYITGSNTLAAGQEDRIVFPAVTRTITVMNHITGGSEEPIRVHFNATGSGNVVGGFHYILLNSDEDSYTISVKCKEIYVSAPSTNSTNAEYRIIAELTNIAPERMYNLTGSGLTD